MPFPSDDVTPPVTKMYLVCTGPGVWMEMWRGLGEGARQKYNHQGRRATAIKPVPVWLGVETSRKLNTVASGSTGM